MRIAIASDIHGNQHAFEAVIEAAAAEADELWCLGDLVGYGGDPDASVALAVEHCAICLAGNHDLAVVDVLSLEDFSRGAALAAQWTKETIQPKTREFLLVALPRGRRRGRRPLPRLPARPDLGVRPLRPDRRAVPGRHGLPRLVHRPLPRRAVLPPQRGRVGHRLDAPRGRRARHLRRRLADQPGQHRAAARRRPAGGLAAARHGGLDGALAPCGVRHRGRAGGDPGGQPARLARRAPSVRSIGRCLDCSPSGWRSSPPCSCPPAAARSTKLIPEDRAQELKDTRRPDRRARRGREVRGRGERAAAGPQPGLRAARAPSTAELKDNLNEWLDQVGSRIPDDCKPAETPTPTATETPTETPDGDADRDAHGDPDRDADGDPDRRPRPPPPRCRRWNRRTPAVSIRGE